MGDLELGLTPRSLIVPVFGCPGCCRVLGGVAGRKDPFPPPKPLDPAIKGEADIKSKANDMASNLFIVKLSPIVNYILESKFLGPVHREFVPFTFDNITAFHCMAILK
jgi:hypothetical protein